MEKQSPLVLNPAFNEPCCRQGSIFERKIFQASFLRCALGFYALRSFYRLQQLGKWGKHSLCQGEYWYQPSFGLLFTNKEVYNGLHSCIFSQNPTKANRDHASLMETQPLGRDEQ